MAKVLSKFDLMGLVRRAGTVIGAAACIALPRLAAKVRKLVIEKTPAPGKTDSRAAFFETIRFVAVMTPASRFVIERRRAVAVRGSIDPGLRDWNAAMARAVSAATVSPLRPIGTTLARVAPELEVGSATMELVRTSMSSAMVDIAF